MKLTVKWLLIAYLILMLALRVTWVHNLEADGPVPKIVKVHKYEAWNRIYGRVAERHRHPVQGRARHHP